MRDNDTIILENFYIKILKESENIEDIEDVEDVDTTPDMSNDNQNLFEQLKAALSKGARIVSFIYRIAGTANKKKGESPNGDTSIYTINLGISYGNLKDHNLKVLNDYQPEDQWEEVAKNEMVQSLSKPYDPSTEAEKKDYINLGHGIRYYPENDYFNILAGHSATKKQLIAKGESKPKTDPFKLSINKDGSPRNGDKAYIARAKRIIEYKLKDQLRRSPMSFDLISDKIAGLKMNGNLIEFQTDNNQPVNV